MSENLFMASHIDEVFEKQELLNAIIAEDWYNQRTCHDFLLATVDEYAEYIKHMSFEWWKKNTPNEAEAKTEIVDMWFFVISSIILKYHKENSCLNTYFLSRIKSYIADALYECKQAYHPKTAIITGTSVLAKMEKFVNSNRIMGESRAIDLIEDLVKMSYAAGLTGDTLFIEYMSKLQLNIFRQQNGYKDGTYIKKWNDEEDNVVLKRIVSKYVDILYTSGNAFMFNDMVMSDMKTQYTMVMKRKNETDQKLLQENS